MMRGFSYLLAAALLALSCSSADDSKHESADAGIVPDLTARDASNAGDAAAESDTEIDQGTTGESFRVVTFNTGTGPGARHDNGPDDGYSSDDAEITDEWYGNGLNFEPLIADTRAWFDAVRPDVVVFQEIFWPGECPNIPVEFHAGFVCEGWQDGEATVAEMVLGPDYQIACHPGASDKCAAVHRDFGSLRGCDEDFCLEGMTGFPVEGCGSRARVARVVIDRVDGQSLTLVNYHGSSGFSEEDRDCRIAQTDQVFVDLGDGEPGANGTENLVMGDLNTDPGRLVEQDPSAARWLDFVGENLPFSWHTEVGPESFATYSGVVAIDHVLSDSFEGECWHAGVTEGREPVSEIFFYDHTPAVCTLR